MASMKHVIIVFLSILTVSFFVKSSHANGGKIATYWGQNAGEGNLTEACDTGDYDIVLLSFLSQFGHNSTPNLDFTGHCGNYGRPCTELEPEIKHCQNEGVKVFLSLGGGNWLYSLSSPDDAKNVSIYLWENYLSGQYGPLGSVTLDGIDLDIEHESGIYYDDLVKELHAVTQLKKFYLSAAPPCDDKYLESAVKTGHLDYVFVKFFNNASCEYVDGDTARLFTSWDAWTTFLHPYKTSLLLGVPATKSAAQGYIPPVKLKSRVLPHINQTSKYGGVMVWTRYYDVQTKPTYSHQIRESVSKSVLRLGTAISDAIFECVTSTLYRLLPKSAPRGLRFIDL